MTKVEKMQDELRNQGSLQEIACIIHNSLTKGLQTHVHLNYLLCFGVKNMPQHHGWLTW